MKNPREDFENAFLERLGRQLSPEDRLLLGQVMKTTARVAFLAGSFITGATLFLLLWVLKSL